MYIVLEEALEAVEELMEEGWLEEALEAVKYALEISNADPRVIVYTLNFLGIF